MKLRTQTLLFLFLFALAPLLLLVSINLPLVLDRIEEFYHGAYLQNLRADFRDLDEHIASRQEMLRLLSKLPEPGILMDAENADTDEIDDARTSYVDWTNRILDDRLDVTRVVFTDSHGNQQFWLERDPTTRFLRPTLTPPPRLAPEFLEASLSAQPRSVTVSAIRVDREGGPFNFLTLNLASPIILKPGTQPAGLVYITVDVGGMARAYAKTLWVHDDGSYLQRPPLDGVGTNAFTDFPGLAEKFAARHLALWESADGRQMIWVPMFTTEDSGVLWVGRAVDTSPLAAFQRALVLRGLIVIVVVILVIWMLASWFAGRAAQFGEELTGGIGRMLADKPVHFRLGGTHELRELGENLSKLAEIHARNTRNLQAHAKELESSNRYKSEFLANVSHELRTPLNSILLLSKMLAQGGRLSPEETQQAQVIHRAGQDLRDLIDNILDLSRIEAGETIVHPETVELPVLLKDLAELVRTQFDAKGLYLDIELDPDAPKALVSDDHKVRQILKNFLSNAVKFTEQGGVRIHLGRGSISRPVRIDVTDTGVGIPRDKHKVIFEAFKQADGSTNRRYGGTGLGLNISSRLAQLLGGEILVTSQPGNGATFSLLLPMECAPPEMAADAVEEPDAGAAAEPETGPPLADFSGHAALVVEGDLGHLLRLAPLLESWGIRVMGAGDREEALEVLADEPECSLALVDVRMPHPETCDTISDIRKCLKGKGIILAMTEDCERDIADATIRQGVDGCVALPVDPLALRDKLAQHFAKTSADEVA